MSFWGVEIKPSKPFTLPQGRIQITQATLGTAGVLTKRSVVQCNVGDKTPVLLCALLPDKIESCGLNLQFDEEDEVTFSVLGPRSVHLTGFYLGSGSGKGERDDDDSDSYGEDIADTDNEDDQSADTVEDSEFDDFIDDDDIEMVSPSKGRKSAVIIEDTDDDEKPANRKGNRKRLKKKYQVSDSDVDDEEFVVKDRARCKAPENEDEDSVPISHIINKKDTTESKEAANFNLANKSKEGNSSSDPGTCQNLNQESNVQVSIAEQISEPPKDFSTPSTDIGQESNVKAKKKKKRSRGEDGDAKRRNRGDVGDSKIENMDQDHVGVKPEEVQPTDKLFKPSKDSFVLSTGIGLETTPKKKHRRNHGEDGDAKTKNLDQDLVGVEPEKEQPTDKLFEPSKDACIPSNGIGLPSGVKPKKKIRRNRGQDVDVKTENLVQDPVEIKPNKNQTDNKTTNSVGHVTEQDNGVAKEKKKKKRLKSAENANDEGEKN